MHSVSRLVVVALVSLVAACGSAGSAADGEKSGYSPPLDEEGYPICDTPPITRDCLQACRHVNCCDPDIAIDDCIDRCEATLDYTGGGDPTPCLAVRILWRNEEGCGTIMRIYETYDDRDVCDDDREY